MANFGEESPLGENVGDYAPIRGSNQTPTGILKRLLKFDCVISFKLVEIGVGCRMAQCSTHCYDLALVMKGMGQDMVKDECRSADGYISIREIEFGVAVELPIRQSRQIRVSLLDDFLLEESRVGDRGTLGRTPIDVRKPL